MSIYISDVISGKPFADGKNGDYTFTSSGEQSQTRRNCSGTISTNTLNLVSTGFVNDDLILIHQTRGLGAGLWELNRVISGEGTPTLGLYRSLSYTYSNSGNSRAQVINVPRYLNATINSGVTLYCPAWNGDNGGIIALAVRRNLVIDGALNTYSRGFWGANTSGKQGEGSAGPRDTVSVGANGNGGGGGYPNGGETASGGGGGNYTSGQAGNTSGSGAVGGSGGSAVSNPSLSISCIGGGGGSGWSNRGDLPAYSGSTGAGIGFIFAYSVDFSSGSANLKGVEVNHDTSNARWGGAGGGGNLFIDCFEGNLGTGIYTYGGTSDGVNFGYGAGGHGLTLVNYYKDVTGTTYPDYVSVQDSRLKESSGMMQIIGS